MGCSTFSMATIALLLSTLVALGMAGTKVTWPMKKSPFSPLPKYTTVFGVPVFADKKTSIAKFQHVASVLASWLDNDQDGCADNPLVIKKLTEAKPRPAVQINELNSKDSEAFDNLGFTCNAPLGANEIELNCVGPRATDKCSDTTLEETLHMVTAHGFERAWPEAFSPHGSKLTAAMDVARGGKFEDSPVKYPSTAWFTYYGCTYTCQVTEYIYWGVSAWVGALVGRGKGIKEEWKFNTRAKLEAGDVLLTAIIKNTTAYKLPTISPTGRYTGPPTCATGVNRS